MTQPEAPDQPAGWSPKDWAPSVPALPKLSARAPCAAIREPTAHRLVSPARCGFATKSAALPLAASGLQEGASKWSASSLLPLWRGRAWKAARENSLHALRAGLPSNLLVGSRHHRYHYSMVQVMHGGAGRKCQPPDGTCSKQSPRFTLRIIHRTGSVGAVRLRNVPLDPLPLGAIHMARGVRPPTEVPSRTEPVWGGRARDSCLAIRKILPQLWSEKPRTRNCLAEGLLTERAAPRTTSSGHNGLEIEGLAILTRLV